MLNPVLSIIILSYNTQDLTLNCLRSVFADKGLELDLTRSDSSLKTPTEIILVDNHSTDSTMEKLKKLKQPLKIIANQENLGFGKGNNQGLKIARGNYILFLNSDTLILHSAISQSLDWLSSHPESYGCTAQLLNTDKTTQASGGFFPNLLNIFTWCLGIDDLPLINKLIKPLHPHTPAFYTHDNFYLRDHPQDWVTGAYFLLRKNVVDAVGGFDPDYFMYSEELEMSYRIHQKFPQNQLWYLVGPQIIHLGGASSADKQKIFDREYQGILHFFKKHRPGFPTAIVNLLITINRILRLTVYQLFSHAQKI
jgi:GT2 family glycosyltransferase